MPDVAASGHVAGCIRAADWCFTCIRETGQYWSGGHHGAGSHYKMRLGIGRSQTKGQEEGK